MALNWLQSCLFVIIVPYSGTKITFGWLWSASEKSWYVSLGLGPLNTVPYIIHIDLCLILRSFGSTFREIQVESHISVNRSDHAQSNDMKKIGGRVIYKKNILAWKLVSHFHHFLPCGYFSDSTSTFTFTVPQKM